MSHLFERHFPIITVTVTSAALLMFLACGGGGSVQNSTSTGSENIYSRGRQIIDEYLKRDASPFRKTRIRFTVAEADEPVRVYEIESSRKQTPTETTTLTEIVLPVEDSGTSTLTLEAKDKKTIVVTYAASRNEFRETDTKKMLFGGLTAGELLGEWEKYDFKLLGEKEISGVKTYEIDGKLKSDADSVVSRINGRFRADNFVPVELHLFGSDGNEIRTYKTIQIKDDPQHPYASRLEVENLVYKSHITIDVLNREFPASIDDSMFVREKLKSSVRK